MVNLLAVVGAAVAAFLIGWIWHSPMVFGNAWMKLNKKTEKDMKEGMKKMPMMAAGQFVASLVTAYVLALFVGSMGSGAMSGAWTGAWAWLGFVATSMIGSVIWEGKPIELFAINAGDMLVTFIVMGAILGHWM